MDQSAFQRYAIERRLVDVYDAHTVQSEEGLLYQVSQTSFVNLIGWTSDCVNSTGERLHISSGYIDRMMPNAFADYWQNYHYIGIHQSMRVTLEEFAYFCMAQQYVFPDIGDPSVEGSPEPFDGRAPGLWLIDQTLQGVTTIDTTANCVLPNDPMRSVLATYLALLMMRFVWLHELAHCTNGHIRFIQDKGLGLSLNEIEDRSSLGLLKRMTPGVLQERSAVLHALEFDADQTALQGCIQIQLANLENIEGIIALDKAMRVRLALFACYAMTWLFEEYQNYFDTKQGLTHPEPYQRFNHILHTMSQFVGGENDALAELDQNVRAQFNELRKVLPSLYYMNTGTNAHQTYSEKLQIVREELTSFKYADPQTIH